MDYYCVYILYSPSADKYYVGQTDNLEQRMQFHNELSENSFTSRYRPWELKRTIPVKTRSQAIRLEKYIKRRKSRQFLETLIQDDNQVSILLDKLSLRSSVG